MTKNNLNNVGAIVVPSSDKSNVIYSNEQVKIRAEIINVMDPPAIGENGDVPKND